MPQKEVFNCLFVDVDLLVLFNFQVDWKRV